MPKITIMPAGINGGLSGGGNKTPPKRGIVNGWSRAAARRNDRFLKSVVTVSLPSNAMVFTLTVRDIPETHADWYRILDLYRKGLYRQGAVMDHWVTEWQKRGAPHLHGVVFFGDQDPNLDRMDLSLLLSMKMSKANKHWLSLTRHLGTSQRGQQIKFMSDAAGWFVYLSKHASRGFAHYQRDKANIPKGWVKTGKMWGKGGDWPLSEEAFVLSKEALFRYRRLVRTWKIKEAQCELAKAHLYNDKREAKAARKRIIYTRNMFKRNKRTESEVRGINERIPDHVAYDMMAFLWSSMGNAHVGPYIAPPSPALPALETA